MKHLEKYNRTKTYMFPNGDIAAIQIIINTEPEYVALMTYIDLGV